MTNSRELAGRVALVTGAGRNIGRSIALALAEAGAGVVLNARSSQDEIDAVAGEITTRGGEAVAVLADVTNPAAVASMMTVATSRFGGLDILVNNAAIRDTSSIDQIGLERWREVVNVVLEGAFICVKASLPALRASSVGAIINIGGLSAHTGAAGRPHVVAAKAGLAGLTRALAHDLSADGITVNCVAPGLIDTVRGASAGESATRGHRAKLVARSGVPDDIAQAVRYLAGPHARFITGQTLHVSGGAYLT